MFCTKCGSQLADGSKFCTNCGASMTPDGAVNPQNMTVNYAAGQPLQKAPASIKRTIARVSLALALVCYFFPFIEMSALWVSQTYSGFKLVAESGSGFIIALLLNIAALVTALTKVKGLIPGILSTCSALMVIILSAAVSSQANDERLYGMVNVDYRFGMILCLLFCAVAAVCGFIDRKQAS